jgi:hypothetical protein
MRPSACNHYKRLGPAVVLAIVVARESLAAEPAPSIIELGEPLSGAPWPRHAIDSSSRGADGVRTGDINGDGMADLATGWEEGGVVRLYLNPGADRARAPWPRVDVGTVPSPEDAVFFDLDGDGQLDILSATEGRERTIFLHRAPNDTRRLSDPSAWITSPLPATAGLQQWMFLVGLQTQGASKLDVIAGSKGPGASISRLRAPVPRARLDAWTLQPLRSAGWIMSLIATDLDDDGDDDLIFSDRRGEGAGVGWLQNPGPSTDPGTHWQVSMLGALGREVMFLDSGDVNNDGRIDIAAAIKPRDILLLQSSGVWSRQFLRIPAVCGTAKAVKLADLDGDSRLDLILSCEQATGSLPGIIWLHHGEAGWHPRHLGGSDGSKFDRIEVLDLDGDGDSDVITCEEADNLGVIWYENPLR